jgi:hypothetical protein
MANNDDNPRRNRDRPEDNPFIAFRRFADSQVSSLLNTVFTLPATIANYNNIHVAREACLFNKGDKTQCDKLEQIESEIAKLRHEGRELCSTGELHEVLKKSEELLKLDRHADEIRRDIVQQSGGHADEDRTAMVQRVANQKGQEWGWDWSWGFPKPFDDDSQSSQPTPDEHNRYTEPWRQMEAEARKIFGDEAWDTAAKTAMDAMEASPLVRGFLGDRGWDELRNMMNSTRGDASEIRDRHRQGQPTPDSAEQLYSPCALESSEAMQRTGVNWRKAYEELVHAEKADRDAVPRTWQGRWHADASYPKRVPWADATTDEPSYEYSHDHEDQHDEPPSPKTKQSDEWCPPAQGQTASETRDLQKFLSDQQQQNGLYLGLRDDVDLAESTFRDWCHPAKDQTAADKRDIQSFLREQQQNGRHLGLHEQADTELDVYERMYETTNDSQQPITPAMSNTTKPSILSTLTTTERTVALDGSVTTMAGRRAPRLFTRSADTREVHGRQARRPRHNRLVVQKIDKRGARSLAAGSGQIRRLYVHEAIVRCCMEMIITNCIWIPALVWLGV